jgi:hypothetical protein
VHNHIILEKWVGGLCNNIVQLCHAVYLTEKTHSRLEVLPHCGLLETHDFDFSSGEKCQETISDHFFWLYPEIFGTKHLDWNIRRKVLKRHIRPMLPARLFPKTGAEGLVIHVRSGDIFKRKPSIKVFKEAANPLCGLKRVFTGAHRVHPLFVQPPLAFYKQIIESQLWPYVLIIAQDTGNPIIHALQQAYSNVEFQLRNIESDIAALLSARNLVFGYGTFGITWALLSDHLQSLYCPAVPDLVFGPLHPGDIDDVDVHTFNFKNYIPSGQWKATAGQKRLMLKYKKKNIVSLSSTAEKEVE